jgi:hypothetical protein
MAFPVFYCWKNQDISIFAFNGPFTTGPNADLLPESVYRELPSRMLLKTGTPVVL